MFTDNYTSRLTNTSAQDVFPISRPGNNNVTYTFGTDSTRPGLTKITLPEGSTWTPGPHWHERYTEYLLVKQGRVRVILDGVPRIVTPDDGVQVVDKFVVHEWMRADLMSGPGNGDANGGEVVVEEWTDPADGVKQVFFRNLLGVLGDAGRYWRGWTTVQVLLICSAYDNYDVLVSGTVPWWVSYCATHLAFLVIRLVARIVGLRPWYEPYTPLELRPIAVSKRLPVRGLVKEE